MDFCKIFHQKIQVSFIFLVNESFQSQTSLLAFQAKKFLSLIDINYPNQPKLPVLAIGKLGFGEKKISKEAKVLNVVLIVSAPNDLWTEIWNFFNFDFWYFWEEHSY